MPDLCLVPPGDGRDRYLPLLFLAEDAHDHVRAHRDDGELFVYGTADDVIGVVQAVPREPSVVELTLVAVDERHQGRGHGIAMLDAVVAQLGSSGASRVVVGTAAAGTGTMRFYQRGGFRMHSVERDYFDAARGYDGTEVIDGLAIRDLVWFDRDVP
ncbi:MAG TPA: GNAT family N-acetyltransferase [Acidimicrobiia bacterium]|nr:GNAT family N-acetyltransferase [Acidimicrobiia bacterium]